MQQFDKGTACSADSTLEGGLVNFGDSRAQVGALVALNQSGKLNGLPNDGVMENVARIFGLDPNAIRQHPYEEVVNQTQTVVARLIGSPGITQQQGAIPAIRQARQAILDWKQNQPSHSQTQSLAPLQSTGISTAPAASRREQAPQPAQAFVAPRRQTTIGRGLRNTMIFTSGAVSLVVTGWYWQRFLPDLAYDAFQKQNEGVLNFANGIGTWITPLILAGVWAGGFFLLRGVARRTLSVMSSEAPEARPDPGVNPQFWDTTQVAGSTLPQRIPSWDIRKIPGNR